MVGLRFIWGCFLGFLNVVVIASLGMCRGGSLSLSFMLFYCLLRVDVWCLFRLGIRISNPLHPTAARRGQGKGRVQWVLVRRSYNLGRNKPDTL